MSKPKPLASDRDSQWKEIIETLFWELIEFCIPDLYKEIDISIKPVFLEQELLEIFPDWGKKGKRFHDKLAKVRLKNGKEKWILIHIEAQENADAGFPERMFVYFYRILDHHKMPVSALAIYTGPSVPKPHNLYQNEFFGTNLTYEFNSLCIRDLDEKTLIQSSNPFALAALAGLYTIKSKNNQNQRFTFKKRLARLLIERNYPKEKIVKLFIFIQYIVNLPKELDSQFIEEIKQQYKASEKMSTTEKTQMSNAELLFMDFIKKAFKSDFEEERQKIEAVRQKVKVEKQKVEAQKQKAEAQKQRAEAERKKAEVEKQKAEVEKQKAEAEKQKAEAERKNYIARFFKVGKHSPDQIAMIMELDLNYVTDVLKEKGLVP